MKIISLGSGGGLPSEARHTASYFVDTGESLIILDAGSGLCRLGNYLDILEKYQEVNIILSHYHLDHVIGISYLYNWGQIKKINVYGPGKSLIFKTCNEVLSSVFATPCFFDLDKIFEEVKLLDYDLQGFNIGNIQIKITPQSHTGGSFGITIDSYVHYATDTIILEDTFEQGEKVKLLLHDCWDECNVNSKDHSSFEQILEKLNKYKIQNIGLIHLNPNWEESKFINLASILNGKENVQFVKDGMIFEL